MQNVPLYFATTSNVHYYLLYVYAPWRSVDKKRQESSRDEERCMTEFGVPQVIPNPLHWKTFLMIYTKTKNKGFLVSLKEMYCNVQMRVEKKISYFWSPDLQCRSVSCPHCCVGGHGCNGKVRLRQGIHFLPTLKYSSHCQLFILMTVLCQKRVKKPYLVLEVLMLSLTYFICSVVVKIPRSPWALGQCKGTEQPRSSDAADRSVHKRPDQLFVGSCTQGFLLKGP